MLEGLAIAQINVTVGDLAGNAARIRRACDEAAARGAKLVVFPELALCGYPPEDLVLRPAFRAACRAEAERLARETADGPALLVGGVWEESGAVYNAALLLGEGRVLHVQPKQCLPNYGIFDEKRLFTPGVGQVVQWGGAKLGILICEDFWRPEVPRALASAGAEIFIIINSSPYEAGKPARRRKLAAETARKTGLPLVYANLVGGQDDIVFDGGSFTVDAAGQAIAQFPYYKECVALLNTVTAAPTLAPEEEIWGALGLGLGDYVRKNGFSGVLLGLSGGIDSAVAAALAADALGPGHVLGVLLPSHLTSPESNEDALALAAALGLRTVTLPIADAFEAQVDTLFPAMSALAPHLPDWPAHLAVGGNLQARIRGALLMALSNATGNMLLSTGNKSEIATGYTTLYGDSCGGYAPLKDVYKTQVYALARWRNGQSPVIPARCLTKAPTAELAPNQKDEDQLPPYPVLDAILARLVEGGQSVADIAAAGFDAALAARVAAMIRAAEYKRRQMPPGPKISPMLFGRDWRYPLTNGFKDSG